MSLKSAFKICILLGCQMYPVFYAKLICCQNFSKLTTLYSRTNVLLSVIVNFSLLISLNAINFPRSVCISHNSLCEPFILQYQRFEALAVDIDFKCLGR